MQERNVNNGVVAVLVSILLVGCGGGDTDVNQIAEPLTPALTGSVQDQNGAQERGDEAADSASDPADTDNAGGEPDEPQVATELDQELSLLISNHGLTGKAALGRLLPGISDPIPQLGMQLFFSKALGGQFDSACVSCHHPLLGGTDNLSLPVGVQAVDPDLLGPGRVHFDGVPPVPRNAPTVFNVALWDRSLFHDSRIESLSPVPGVNGAGTPIRTPDTDPGVADLAAGQNLTAAQARFPVTSAEEMRGDVFESGASNDQVRDHLAARLGSYGIGAAELPGNNWLARFQEAFGSSDTAETLVTFDNIAQALAHYQRSMVFVDNPWSRYVDGDLAALSEPAKRGASLFLRTEQQGGAGCATCHQGDFFTDEGHHVLATPQIGPGKGDGDAGTGDAGRGRETDNPQDQFRFRTPSLLNVEVTAPYMHAGAFDSLERVVQHYNNPQRSAQDYFNNAAWCELPQFLDMPDCTNLYPDARTNTQAALNQLEANRRARVSQLPNINLSSAQVQDLVTFLLSLTDPCIKDRRCLSPWIPDTLDSGPDGFQLNATGVDGGLL